MALITDPDDLNQGTEVTINTSTLRITLNVAGNLSNDGVTHQALYSFLKEEWRTDAALIPFPFPMLSLTNEQFEWIEDWEPFDDTTRNLIRTGGWRENNAAGATKREYAGIVSLGDIDSGTTPYYAFAGAASKTDFDFAGTVNQAIQTFGDASNGNFDSRNSELTVYVRSQGRLYGLSTTTAIGVSGLSYITYRFPLAEATDLKITESDANIDANAPYTGMSITYGAAVRNIGGSNFNFGVVIDGNNGTAEEIYEFVQRQLRLDADIDDGAGTKNGFLAEGLLQFIGDTLQTQLVTEGGVYIDNFNSNDTNRLQFTDDTGTIRTFPFVAAGTITFNNNLVNDTDAIYRMFFTTNPGGDFGTSSAILVDDNSGADIAGTVGGNTTIAFDFDYDGNVQGGRTAGTDAAVTVVAIGLSGAQYVVAEATITRAVGQNISLVAALERNYQNA